MTKTVYTGLAVLVAGVVAALLFPHARLWGLHFLAYDPPAVRVVFAAAAALCVVLSFVPWRRRAATAQSGPADSWRWDLLAALGCGVVFLLLSAKTALLGDGQLWLNGLQAGASDYLRNRAPLSLYLLHALYGWLNPRLGIGAMRLFGLVSVLSGAAAVLGWPRLARYLRIGRGTALLLGATWSGVALFCGYVETYVTATAALTWMLVAMIISLREEKPSWWVPLLLLLAAGLSLAALVFLPAVVAYSWRMLARRTLAPRKVLAASVGTLLPATAAYFLMGWYRGTDLLLPLWPTGNAFGDWVFGPAHLADMANALILSGSGLLLMLCALWAGTRKSGWQWSDERLVLALAVGFPLLALMMHNPQLGMARDWDIAATLLLTAPLLSMLLWDAIRPQGVAAVRLRGALAVWLLLVIAPWAGVQASEAQSLTRFSDLLQLDGAKSESGWDYLNSYYFRLKRYDEWAHCNFEAMKLSANPRYHANAALYYSMRQEWGNARVQAEQARAAVMKDSALTEWERDVTDPEGLVVLGNSYLQRSRVREALQTFAVAAVLQPESSWPGIARTDLYLGMRDLSQARQALAELAAKSDSLLAEARAHFVARTRLPSNDQQLTGWVGLALVADVKRDSVAAAKAAEEVSKRTHDANLVAQLRNASTPATTR